VSGSIASHRYQRFISVDLGLPGELDGVSGVSGFHEIIWHSQPREHLFDLGPQSGTVSSAGGGVEDDLGRGHPPLPVTLMIASVHVKEAASKRTESLDR